MFTFEKALDLINSELENLNWSRKPIGLYEPIGYILSLGGKRIRPVVTLMTYNLYADDVSTAMKPALGLEVFHNFTLLHDDIMDRADMRRGKPTVHKKWDDNTAILSGDVMQIEAYKLIAETPEKHLKAVLDLFSKTAAEICEGQQYDMEFESRDNVSAEEYIEMIRLKTAVLIAAGAKIGAILGGGTKEDAEHLYKFGNAIGLAFQRKDDLLDVYGNEADFGKKIGGDILCNKKTYLLIHALKNATGEDADTLNYWLRNKDENQSKSKIKAVTEIYNRLGIKEACEAKMESYYHEAVENLAKVQVPKEKKQELRALTQKLMSRND
ncbi:MAG: polyprenyl synthetase family protein [Porphyromonadaceae bacterium]|nr:polyprenyl synthetase family protein [Porphyromonadaceae bacterium]